MKSLNRDEGNICFNILTMSRKISQSFVTVNPYTNNDFYTRYLERAPKYKKEGKKRGEKEYPYLVFQFNKGSQKTGENFREKKKHLFGHLASC